MAEVERTNTYRFEVGMQVTWDDPNRVCGEYGINDSRGRHGPGPFLVVEVAETPKGQIEGGVGHAQSVRLAETWLGKDANWFSGAWFKPL